MVKTIRLFFFLKKTWLALRPMRSDLSKCNCQNRIECLVATNLNHQAALSIDQNSVNRIARSSLLNDSKHPQNFNVNLRFGPALNLEK